MSESVLDRKAVGIVDSDEAMEILQAYIMSGPVMAFNHALQAAAQPRGTGAGDHLVQPQ